LATDLPTHTQVLDSEIAELVSPTPEDMAKGMRNLLTSSDHRKKIGQSAKARAEKLYTFEVFQKRLNELYDGVTSYKL
jgi:glycosyltransferase involved in cell wall biosynthesis